MSQTRTFGTILGSQRFRGAATVKRPTHLLTVPPNFDPFNHWGNLLPPVINQGSCQNCFCCASVFSFQARLSLFTNGAVRVPLSTYEPTICDGVIRSDQPVTAATERVINNIVHSGAACTGNTIENIMIFLYEYGTQETGCFDMGVLKKRGYTPLSRVTDSNNIPWCGQVIGAQLAHCSDGTTPARFFRAIAYYSLYPSPDCIRNEIYRWGPVVVGMTMYDSFMAWDGTGIYTGPHDGEAPLGGHAVCAVGWGVENGIEYYWIANSWGTDYGIQGYFKIKVGVCDLEKNAMALIPDTGAPFDLALLDYAFTPSKEQLRERDWFNVDPVTGYKRGMIPSWARAIVPSRAVPDFRVFMAGKLSDDNVVSSTGTGKYRNLRVVAGPRWWLIVLLYVLSLWLVSLWYR